MTRLFQIPNEPLVGEAEIVVELPHALTARLAIELSLLLEGLSGSLRIRADRGLAILVSIDNRAPAGMARVEEETATGVEFRLARNQAEFLHAVLLRAYRDGLAEANHVHLDGTRQKHPFSLTFFFELYREPMSGEEAIKRLK